MLWPKASPLDLDFGICAQAKLFKKSTAHLIHFMKIRNGLNDKFKNEKFEIYGIANFI